MVFKFSKSQTVEILRILFLISHLGLKETSELFFWIRFYLSFTGISEFRTDLRLITRTRLCFNAFRSINF